MKILIDDERRLLPDESVPDIIATSFLAGELVLGIATEKDEIWLDHDLGDEDPDKTGYRLITNYEEFIAHKHSIRVYPAIPQFHIITNNPAGRNRISQAIVSIERLRADVEPERRGHRRPQTRFARERSAAPWRIRKEERS